MIGDVSRAAWLTEGPLQRGWLDARRVFMGFVDQRRGIRVGANPFQAIVWTAIGEMIVFSVPSPTEIPDGLRQGGGTLGGAIVGFFLLVAVETVRAPRRQDRERHEASSC